MAFRASSIAQGTSTTLAPSLPTGTVSTDVVIALIGSTDTGMTVTAPAGWTFIREQDGTTGNFSTTFAYWALGSVASTSFTLSGSSNKSIVLASFSGRSTSAPIRVSGGNQGFTSSATLPSVAAGTGDDVFAIWESDATLGSLPSPWTDASSAFRTTTAYQNNVTFGNTAASVITLSRIESWATMVVSIPAASPTAISYVQSATGTATGTTLTSGSATWSANNVVIVAFGASSGSVVVNTITASGGTIEPIALSTSNKTSSPGVAMWVIFVRTGFTGTFSLNLSGSTNAVAVFSEYSGVSALGVGNSSAPTATANPSLSLTFTQTFGGQPWTVAAAVCNSVTASTAGSANLRSTSSLTNVSVALVDSTSATCDVTHTSANWGIGIVELYAGAISYGCGAWSLGGTGTNGYGGTWFNYEVGVPFTTGPNALGYKVISAGSISSSAASTSLMRAAVYDNNPNYNLLADSGSFAFGVPGGTGSDNAHVYPISVVLAPNTTYYVAWNEDTTGFQFRLDDTGNSVGTTNYFVAATFGAPPNPWGTLSSEKRGPHMWLHVLPVSGVQEGFRWGVDNGSESAHTWEAAQDTSITIAANQARLLRTLIDATGDPTSTAYTLRAQKNGTGGYVAVPVGATTSAAISTPVIGTVAYSSLNGTSVAPTYPSGISASDTLVLIVGQKPSTANGGTAATPSGWTLIASRTGANDGDTGGYGTTTGADVGNTNIYVYTKDSVAGTESGTLSVTVGTNNICWAGIVLIPKTGSGTWSIAADTGKDTVGGNVSIASSAGMNIAAGDMLLGAMVIPTDVTTPNQFSAEAFSQTGTTFGTASEITEPDTNTGDDIGGFIFYQPASSGSGTGVVTMSATAGGTTTNVRGPGIILRARVTGLSNEVYVSPSSNIASNDTITLDTRSTGTATATSVTLSHTVNAGANRVLIVQAAANFGVSGTLSGATYGGVAMTQISSADSGSIAAWYLLNPPVGTANIVVSQSVSRNILAVGTSLFGVNQLTPCSNPTFAYGSSGTVSTVTVPSATGSWVMVLSADDSGTTTWTPTGAQTASGTLAISTTSGAWGTGPGSASTTMSWTTTGANLSRNLAFSVQPVYGEPTTARLTPPSGKTTADFATGRRWDNANGSDAIDITTDDYTELEWSVAIASTAANGDYYDFRTYAGSTALDTYSVTPRWTIGNATPLTPSLFTNSQTFYAPTVSATRTLTASLYTNSQTFYSPTVSAGSPQTLTAALFTNSQTFYAPTVSASRTLTAALFTNSQTFFAPTVSTSYALTASLFTNSQTFYSATVNRGTVTLLPSLYTNAQTFYSATVALTYAITPSLYVNAQTFYSATVASSYTLAPAQYTNTQAFYSATVATTFTITPSLYTNTQTFYTPTVAPIYNLSPSLYVNSQAFYAATVVATNTLLPSLYANSQAFYTPTVTPTYSLTPALYTNAQTFYTQTVTATYALTPALYVNSQTFYTATVAATYSIQPSLYTNDQSFYSITVVATGATQTLRPSLYENSQTFFDANVSTTYALAPTLVTNNQLFYSPAISAAYELTPSLYINGEVVFDPSLSFEAFVSPSLYTNTQLFFTATVTSSGQVNIFNGDVGPTKRKKRKQREFDEERAAREALRESIRQAIEPVKDTPQVTVLASKRGSMSAVSVIGADGAIQIPVPPQFSAAQVAAMVAIELERINVAVKRIQARQAMETMLRREMARIAKRRKDDELIMLLS